MGRSRAGTPFHTGQTFIPSHSQPLDVGSLQRAGVTLGRICLFSSMKFLEQDLAKRFELPTLPPPGTMTTLGLRRRTELCMQQTLPQIPITSVLDLFIVPYISLILSSVIFPQYIDQDFFTDLPLKSPIPSSILSSQLFNLDFEFLILVIAYFYILEFYWIIFHSFHLSLW